MPTVLVTKHPTLFSASTDEGRQKIAEEFFEDIRSIARERNGRLGTCELWADGTLRLDIPNDDVLPNVERAITASGMTIQTATAEEMFIRKYEGLGTKQNTP